MSAELAYRAATEADHEQISALHLAAFGDERLPRLVERLRAGAFGITSLALVAVAGDRVVGHVMLTGGLLDAPR